MTDRKLKKQIATLSDEKRFELACEKTDRSVGSFLRHLKTHYNNKHVVYSDVLSSQIPKSYAANAFIALQEDLFQFEVIRLTRFWESSDLDGFSIPIIVELVDTEYALDQVGQQAYKEYAFHDVRRAKIWAKLAQRRFKRAVAFTREVVASKEIEAIKNTRNRLAHALERTRIEKKKVPQTLRYGDEKHLLSKTQKILDDLHMSLNGAGFDWDGACEMNGRNTKALWHGVKIEPLE